MSEIKGEISGLNDRMENLIAIIVFVPNAKRKGGRKHFPLRGKKRLFNISSFSCAANLPALSRRSGCIFCLPFLSPPTPVAPPPPPPPASFCALFEFKSGTSLD